MELKVLSNVENSTMDLVRQIEMLPTILTDFGVDGEKVEIWQLQANPGVKDVIANRIVAIIGIKNARTRLAFKKKAKRKATSWDTDTYTLTYRDVEFKLLEKVERDL